MGLLPSSYSSNILLLTGMETLRAKATEYLGEVSTGRTQLPLFPGWSQNIALFKATEVEEGKESLSRSIEVFLAAVKRPML